MKHIKDRLIIGSVIIVIIAIVGIVSNCNAQSRKIFPINENGIVEYTIQQKVDTALKKTHLFSLSKMWISYLFNDAREVIIVDDKEAGIIVGKGSFIQPMKVGIVGPVDIRVSFRLNVKVKDSSFYLNATDFEANYIVMNTNQSFVLNNNEPTKNAKNIYEWRNRVNATMTDFINSFYKYIEKNKSDFIKVNPDEKVGKLNF